MTPAETLRAAAHKLRTVASAATDGPWRPLAGGNIVMTDAPEWYVVENTSGEPPVTPEDATWIALLSPAIAEPLAAWLEEEAMSARWAHPDSLPDYQAPWDLALAILGDDND